ncbi:oligosaccharide flippase family protein [Nostoc sp. FACHB-888]|uniref:oligosaccharide flippase family protein n=1 Tax=Nostoc sp. FACHB-888 TaxID=2692842 RepID=UPI0016859F08|nr:oligosaccharide flippase family protein [Nostoc sp. FACHB-888]MBD2245266.1 oligosaccharide flippase family protein [Nostoc sp. FACHB-888]
MNLRSQVLHGGVYLAIRQGIGMVISLVGVLLLTRAIGPEQYGLYAATFGLFSYFQNICQLGIVIYLVRHKQEDSEIVYHQAFTLLFIMSLCGLLLGKLAIPLIENWVRLQGFGLIFQALLLSLPVVLLSQVPLARLEQQLDYKRIAWMELVGQLAYFVFALAVAFKGGGAWGPVVGWWAQQLHMLILFFWCTRYKPRFCWQANLVKKMIGYSLGYSASVWVWQLRYLVNPLIVGRFLGAEAVGYVALANRIAEMLGFVKTATFRLSIAALARLQDDRNRLVQAITDGMKLQILALGPLLTIVAWLGPWFMPLMFGPKWLPVMEVYPFIAASLLANSLFTLHSSALFVLHRNWGVAVFHIIHIVLFFGAALLWLPRVGLVGFGWAELSTIASYGIIHSYLVRNVNSPDYRFAGLLAIAFGLALFPYQLGWWVVLGLVVVLLLPDTQHKLIDLWKSFRSARNAS